MSVENEERIRLAIEAAFREGCRNGYSEGGSDQCSYEWGGGSRSDEAQKRTQDDAWSYSDAKKVCPKCGSENTDKRHHEGSFLICETDWQQCEDCDHQWNHQ